jgi:hypothetical protein
VHVGSKSGEVRVAGVEVAALGLVGLRDFGKILETVSDDQGQLAPLFGSQFDAEPSGVFQILKLGFGGREAGVLEQVIKLLDQCLVFEILQVDVVSILVRKRRWEGSGCRWCS